MMCCVRHKELKKMLILLTFARSGLLSCVYLLVFVNLCIVYPKCWKILELNLSTLSFSEDLG
jgi:hypothetical protein